MAFVSCSGHAHAPFTCPYLHTKGVQVINAETERSVGMQLTSITQLVRPLSVQAGFGVFC